MNNIVILDVDVRFRQLYRGQPGKWRQPQSDGFVSVEYFYEADDELVRNLVGKSLFFSTGGQDTVLDALLDAGAEPFAARSSGRKSYSAFKMEETQDEDDQPSRIKAMVDLVRRKEGEIGGVYRMACPLRLYKDALRCVDLDEGRIVPTQGLVQRCQKGVLRQLADGNGKIVVQRAAASHMARIYCGWYELEGGDPARQRVVLPPPSAEAAAERFDDDAEAVQVSRGGAFGGLFAFLATRQDKELTAVANSWRTVQFGEKYRPVNLFAAGHGCGEEFDTSEEAERHCVEYFVSQVKPQLQAQGSNVGGVRTTHGPFRVYLRLRDGCQPEYVTIDGREAYFTPGKAVDLFKVEKIKKRAVTESQPEPPWAAFWRRTLSKMYY